VLPLRVLRLDDEQPLVKDATARLSG
jgi:hypothetical protein